MILDPIVACFLLALAGSTVYRKFYDKHYFTHIPAQANQLNSQGKYPEAIALLQPLLHRPAFGGEHVRVAARFYLAQAYQNTQQYEQAIEQVRAALQTFAPTSSPEWYLDLTLILVECLLAQGWDSEAQAEIAHVETVLQKATPNARLRLLRARWLEFQFRFAEAAKEYQHYLNEESAKLAPPDRHQYMVYLTHLHFNAEHYEEALQTARRIREDKPASEMYVTVCSLAGFCACYLGDINEALRWYADAFDIAPSLPDKQYATLCEKLFAEIQFSQGQIDNALEIVKRLPSDTNTNSDSDYLIRAFLVRGNYVEVIRLTKISLEALQAPLPRINAWTRANTELGIARAYLEIGEAGEALRYLQKAAPIVNPIDFSRFYCESLRLWAATQLLPDDATTQEQIHDLAQILFSYAGAGTDVPRSIGSSAGFLSISACNIGDYEMGLRLVNLFAQGKHAPVYHCIYLYHLAVCLEGTGQIAEARTAYEKCIAKGTDIPRCQKAKEALVRL